jgi:hypothetical protein
VTSWCNGPTDTPKWPTSVTDWAELPATNAKHVASTDKNFFRIVEFLTEKLFPPFTEGLGGKKNREFNEQPNDCGRLRSV